MNTKDEIISVLDMDNGMLRAYLLDSVQDVPDDLDNRHRKMIQEWLNEGNILTEE